MHALFPSGNSVHKGIQSTASPSLAFQVHEVSFRNCLLLNRMQPVLNCVFLIRDAELPPFTKQEYQPGFHETKTYNKQIRSDGPLSLPSICPSVLPFALCHFCAKRYSTIPIAAKMTLVIQTALLTKR